MLARSRLAAVALLAGAVPAPAAPADEGCVALVVRGQRLLDAGEAASALPPLREAAHGECPVRDLALVLAARAALRSGLAEEALTLATSVGLVPRTVRGGEAAWIRAEALEAVGRHGEAVAAWRQVRTGAAPSRRLEAMLREAGAAERSGRLAEAASIWRTAALQHAPGAPDDALERAEELSRRGSVPWISPTPAELLARATSLADGSRHQRAVRAYRDAESAASGATRLSAMLGRARSHWSLRENAEAWEACAALLAGQPSLDVESACLALQARTAWRVGDAASVLATTQRAFDAHRRPVAAWRDDLLSVRAGYFMEQRLWEEAVSTYDALVAQHPTSSLVLEAKRRAAWCRLLQRRAPEAAERFDALAAAAAARGDEEMKCSAPYWAAVALDAAGRGDEAVRRWEDLALARPYCYFGGRALDRLADRLPAERVAAIAATARTRGARWRAPAPPRLETVNGVRYAILRDAGLPRAALDEIEAHRRLVRDDDSLVLELARARLRAGKAASAAALVAGRFGRRMEDSVREAGEPWTLLHPSHWEALVDEAAAQCGLDPSLVRAVIRSESAWDPDALSSADARGLMQVIPPTGARLARDEGIERFDPDALFEPEVNVRLGTRYLAELAGQFAGDEAAMIAAYNAGEDKVAAWWADLHEQGVRDQEERIERIPYRETRVYVKRVLEAADWYRWIAAQGGAPPSPPVPAGAE